jgi:hypothetical protein
VASFSFPENIFLNSFVNPLSAVLLFKIITANIAHSEYDAMAPVVRFNATFGRCCNPGHHIQSTLFMAGTMINIIQVNPETSADNAVCFVVLSIKTYNENPIIAKNQFRDSTIPNANAAPTPPSNFHQTGQLFPIITPTQ